MVRKGQGGRDRRSSFLRVIFAVSLAFTLSVPSSRGWQEPVTSTGDTFSRAVDAYNNNRFNEAQNLFSTVTGSHTQEAKVYLTKITSYKDALETAQTMLTRSPDEMDSASLDLAIREIQEAISIKPDGPYHPNDLLAKAKSLQSKVAQGERTSAATRNQELCRMALDASNAHRYKEAEHFSCLVAYDNPAFQCGGDEAAHICQEMRELLDSIPQESSESAPRGSSSDFFERAKRAYESNDFQQAQRLFQRVSRVQKEAASEYLDKITRYTAAMQQGVTASSASKYEDAKSSYRQAAAIKRNGPGNPEEQAAIIDLQEGIDEFYSGHYQEAQQHLSIYNQENPRKPDLAHFYLGASKLAQFYLAGGHDASLRESALVEFREARKAGFSTRGHPVSPKILADYQQLPD